MATVHLQKPDLALFSDPVNTRVIVPHMIAAPRTRRWEQASVRFEGDTAPTVFRGEGVGRSYGIVCRYSHVEHDDMAALLRLLESAHTAPDGRIQLRTNFFDAGGLDRYEVVTVADVTETHVKARAWDVSFTATTVQHTLAV